MTILKTSGWSDYELLDSGNGRRLERFGKYILDRPDPQTIWQQRLSKNEWNKANAFFEKTTDDKGKWNFRSSVPESWNINYKDLVLKCRLSPFKHTGVFPEQVLNWEWIEMKIKNEKIKSKNVENNQEIKILNLFAYTGVSSVVMAKAGAKVTHVDSSYSAIGWSKENQKLSRLSDDSIRWIEDDAIKFCEREIKRGNFYDGIIMDPPIFGHGPNGETWSFNESFPKLMSICHRLMSANPLFFVVNAYAISSSFLMLENVLKDYFKTGNLESGELVLAEKDNGRLLSTGIFSRWSNT